MCKNAPSQEHSCKPTSPRGYANMHNMNINEQREQQRRLVDRMAAALNTDYTGLARIAGVAASTITRFMNSNVEHLLTTRTLAKLENAAHLGVQSATAPFPRHVGQRMRMARQAMAPDTPDDKVAAVIGWSEDQMRQIFAGAAAPSWDEFRSFTRRMRVTSDFLLFGSLEGLSVRAEARLLAAFPSLVADPEDIGSRTGTDPA